ncbi:MAG: terminase large subunit domain-containing protein [Tabrizicola sp.]
MTIATEIRDRWATAVPDWEARILAGQSLIPDLPLDAERAERALRLFRQLRVPDIPGLPTYGEVCAPFVFDLVKAMFGAFDRETGLRAIREYFLLIPKKNGKTSIAAAMMVVALILNERPAAEALLIAPTIAIADRSYVQAKGIIRATTLESGIRLDDVFSTHDHIKTIRYLHPTIPSELQIKAADAEVITGSKASYVLIDETHVFASRPSAKWVFLEIRGGLSHPQNTGFLLQITTQSKTPPAGVFRAELAAARDVRDGRKTAPLLAVLYELPRAMQADGSWRDPATWGLVNPHLNRSVDAQFLAEELDKAEADGEDALALVASQHFNVEIGVGQNADAWPGARHWVSAGRDWVTLDHILTNCEVCTVGGDWGGADDLAALCVLGRTADKRWLAWVRAWARPSVFRARPKIAPTLRDFVEDGDLRIVETGEQQAAEAADLCLRVREAGLLPEIGGIGLDAAGIDLLLDALATRGLVPPQVVPVGQGWKLQSAVSGVPLRLEAGSLLHGNQRLLNWAVGNAKQRLKGSNYVIEKELAGAAKIDPLIALFNAAMRMRENPTAGVVGSYIDREPVLVL